MIFTWPVQVPDPKAYDLQARRDLKFEPIHPTRV